MIEIKQTATIIVPQKKEGWEVMIDAIATTARVCYQSEADSYEDNVALVKKLVARGHHAMLEFGHVTVDFITDRGISHEIVRHRLFSFAQESTRYCRYKDGQILYVLPSTWDSFSERSKTLWRHSMAQSEVMYIGMLEEGCSPQQARAVLPNSLKTQLRVKGNLRQWLHFFELRDSKQAHPDMQALVAPLHQTFKDNCPEVFG